MTDESKDLELQPDDAEQIVGGAGRKHKSQTRHTKIVGGGIKSTNAASGTPSPLATEPVESYMDTSGDGGA